MSHTNTDSPHALPGAVTVGGSAIERSLDRLRQLLEEEFANEFQGVTCDGHEANAIDGPLSPALSSWVQRYQQVGHRSPYLWNWCCRGVELTTLSAVAADWYDCVRDTKVLGVMFDVLLDDVADRSGDEVFLEHLIQITLGGSPASSTKLTETHCAYAEVTRDVWQEIRRRVERFPYYASYADLLNFDYWQLINAMHYSRLLNRIPAILNLTEHDLYLPHNMHMMISATMDLMCSPDFDTDELGLLREAVWHAQYMGRIGNLVTTWQRELHEGDFSSGVFAGALSQGEITAAELLHGDPGRIEEVIIQSGQEDFFLRRWCDHRRALQQLASRVRTVDIRQLVAGLDRLICLHLGSRGRK